MENFTALRLFCIISSLLLTLTALTAAPYPEYDADLQDLYKILLHQDDMDGIHQMERRSRGPQLRLRFGKRADELEHYMMNAAANERPPSLRLRFGKRSEDTPISPYISGPSSEGEN